MLTSQAREILRGVEHVIVDEVHAIAGSKRGAHLALSLERLERLIASGETAGAKGAARRSGSGSARPSGRSRRSPGSSAASGPGREVTVVDAGSRKPLELRVIVPIEDMTAPGEILPLDQQPGGPATNPEASASIWPAIHPAILQLIREHRSTIVFTNSRRLAERLAQRLNDLAGEELVRAHHGSSPASSASRSRRSSRPAACRRSSRRAASNSASTWARSTSSSRSRARRRSRAVSSGSGGPATRSARHRRA